MFLRDVILARLASLGWTQADLSRATGIPKQNLSPMLRGERAMRINHLLLFDHVLNLCLDYNDCSLGEAKVKPKSKKEEREERERQEALAIVEEMGRASQAKDKE